MVLHFHIRDKLVTVFLIELPSPPYQRDLRDHGPVVGLEQLKTKQESIQYHENHLIQGERDKYETLVHERGPKLKQSAQILGELKFDEASNVRSAGVQDVQFCPPYLPILSSLFCVRHF